MQPIHHCRATAYADRISYKTEEERGTRKETVPIPCTPPARRRDRRQRAQRRASLATCSACMARAASTQQLAPLPARAGHCSARRRMSSPVTAGTAPAPTPEREGKATAAGGPRPAPAGLVIGMAVADGQKRNLYTFQVLAQMQVRHAHDT